MALTAFIFGLAVSLVIPESKSSFKTVPFGPMCIMKLLVLVLVKLALLAGVYKV